MDIVLCRHTPRERLLAGPNSTLDKAIRICQVKEAAYSRLKLGDDGECSGIVYITENP